MQSARRSRAYVDRLMRLAGGNGEDVDSFSREVVATVEREADGPLRAGRARISVQTFEDIVQVSLEPTDDEACRIAIAANGPGAGELTVTIGDAHAHYEFWRSRGAEPMSHVVDVVQAVLAGRVEEWRRGRSIVGLLHLANGDFWFGHNAFLLRRRGRSWKHVTYEPY